MAFFGMVLGALLDPIIIAVVLGVMAFAKELRMALRAVVALIASVGAHAAFLPKADITATTIAALIWIGLYWIFARIMKFST